MEALNWELLINFPNLFTSALFQLGVCFSNDNVDLDSKLSLEKEKSLTDKDPSTLVILQQVYKYILFLETFSLQHPSFYAIPYSI